MIEHVSVPVRDYVQAKEFYRKALAPLGYELKRDFPEYNAAGFMEGGHASFLIVQKDGMSEGIHVALHAKNKRYAHSIKKHLRQEGRIMALPDRVPIMVLNITPLLF